MYENKLVKSLGNFPGEMEAKNGRQWLEMNAEGHRSKTTINSEWTSL